MRANQVMLKVRGTNKYRCLVCGFEHYRSYGGVVRGIRICPNGCKRPDKKPE